MLGLAAQTNSARRRIQSLVQLNLELAKVEAKQKAAALGIAGGLGLLAAVLAVYGIGFAFASAQQASVKPSPSGSLFSSSRRRSSSWRRSAGLLGEAFRPQGFDQLKAIEEAERTAQTFQRHG